MKAITNISSGSLYSLNSNKNNSSKNAIKSVTSISSTAKTASKSSIASAMKATSKSSTTSGAKTASKSSTTSATKITSKSSTTSATKATSKSSAVTMLKKEQNTVDAKINQKNNELENKNEPSVSRNNSVCIYRKIEVKAKTQVSMQPKLTSKTSYNMLFSNGITDKVNRLADSIANIGNKKIEDEMARALWITKNTKKKVTCDKDKNVYTYVNSKGRKIEFHIGKPKQPEWKVNKQYDNDFAYDSKAKAKLEDYYNWLKWKVINEGAQHGERITKVNIPDGIATYEHYRSNNGTDFTINYERAYNEDSNIKAGVDSYLKDTQVLIEGMIKEGAGNSFQITSELLNITGKYYPETENWQKAIGGHKIWISADVEVTEKGHIIMDAKVHEIDRYNFDKGKKDIKSGKSDEENGRFEQLGWAKSFNTIGEVNIKVQWDKGNISNSSESEVKKNKEVKKKRT